MNFGRGGWLIVLTLAVAFLLSLARAPLGWPDWVAWLRPGWVVLVIFFWALHFPQRLGLLGAWVLGLFVDIALAHPLGLNGLLFATTAYLTRRLGERLRMYTVVQQAFVVAALVLMAGLLHLPVHEPAVFWLVPTALPAVASLLLWAPLQWLLATLARRCGVE